MRSSGSHATPSFPSCRADGSPCQVANWRTPPRNSGQEASDHDRRCLVVLANPPGPLAKWPGYPAAKGSTSCDACPGMGLSEWGKEGGSPFPWPSWHSWPPGQATRRKDFPSSILRHRLRAGARAIVGATWTVHSGGTGKKVDGPDGRVQPAQAREPMGLIHAPGEGVRSHPGLPGAAGWENGPAEPASSPRGGGCQRGVVK
jgi:hypothetical protein